MHDSTTRTCAGSWSSLANSIPTLTGMKNYIANGRLLRDVWLILLTIKSITEHGPWDTSKALVRRTLHKCIQLGREDRAHGSKADEYEAYRLLGQAVRPSSLL